VFEVNLEMEEEVDMMVEIDPNNRNRSFKNILSKKKISKYEMDEIFG
jgi:hypothetical protein